MDNTKYLTEEASYFPWKAAIKSLEYVDAALKRTDAYGDFLVKTLYYNKKMN